jgi:hypothetical protein
MGKFHFICALWSVRKSGWCLSRRRRERSDFFNLDPQRWAESGGVCGFWAERQRKALLISILFCRGAFAASASRLAFRRRVVKDYDMITRRSLVLRQKDAGKDLSVRFYGQNQLGHGFQVSI